MVLCTATDHILYEPNDEQALNTVGIYFENGVADDSKVEVMNITYRDKEYWYAMAGTLLKEGAWLKNDALAG